MPLNKEELLREEPKIDAALKNLLAYLYGKASIQENNRDNMQMPQVRTVMASLSRQINAIDIKTLDQQIDNNKSVVEAISAIDRESIKITHSLGRTSLKVILPTVKDAVIKECLSKNLEEEFIDDILKLFSSSLEEVSTSESSEFAKELNELIWTKDLKQTLKERHDRRVEAAKERLGNADEPSKIEEITED